MRLATFARLLDRGVAIMAGGALALLLALALVQIVARNLLSTGFPAIDGMSRLLVMYVALGGAALAAGSGSHIRVDLLAAVLPRFALILARPFYVFSAVVSGALAWAALRFWIAEWPVTHTTERALFAGVLILPVGYGLVALRFLIAAITPDEGDR